MSEDTSHSIVASTRSFFSGTMLSRISGMLRDMSLAFFFGSSPMIAAFMVAYRFANLLRRLLGEGTLQSSFVPHFAAKKADSPKDAALFFRDVFFTLSLVLFLVVGAGEGVLYWYLQSGLSESMKEIIQLSMSMLPGLIFICLYALCSSHLQCERKFFLPAAAPVSFNLIWILAAFLVHAQIPAKAGQGLAVGVVIAFFLQWVMTAYPSFRMAGKDLEWKDWFSARLFSKQLKGLTKPLSLGVVGVAATQVNTALDALFARFADVSGPAYLWYAIRLQQMPIALFGIAIAGALLPTLSRQAKAENWEQYRSLLQFALSLTIALMMAATGGIFALGGSSINLIYGRGSFDPSSVSHTLICLWGYGIGLLPSAFVLLLASSFYARKEYFIPAISALLSVFINVVLNALFVFVLDWGAASIAIATSISALFNCLFLAHFLAQKVSNLFSSKLLLSFAKTTVAVLAASLSALCIGKVFCQDPTLALLSGKMAFFPRGVQTQLLGFFLPASSFFIVLFLTARLLHLEEMLALFRRKLPLSSYKRVD